MAISTAIAGVAGAVISGAGAIQAGQAQQKAATYQAQVAKNNSLIAEQNAQHAEEAGLAQAQASSLKARATSGRIRAAQAASGIDVNTGSAVDVQESAAEQGHQDTETVMSNAELQAYGYRSQGTGFNAQAGLDEQVARQAPIGAAFSATGGLLSSASSVGSKWAQAGGTLGGGSSPGAPLSLNAADYS